MALFRRCVRVLSLAVLAVTPIPGCVNGSGLPSGPSEGAVFKVLACTGSVSAPSGQEFRILLQDSVLIQQATTRLSGVNMGVVAGSLRTGDGGFNAPWSWHLDPASITFPDAAAEVCDGCPASVETNLGDWLRLGQFCPWSAVVLARER
jgi:hypothetical protein